MAWRMCQSSHNGLIYACAKKHRLRLISSLDTGFVTHKAVFENTYIFDNFSRFTMFKLHTWNCFYVRNCFYDACDCLWMYIIKSNIFLPVQYTVCAAPKSLIHCEFCHKISFYIVSLDSYQPRAWHFDCLHSCSVVILFILWTTSNIVCLLALILLFWIVWLAETH